MKCYRCGFENNPEVKFCKECGNQIIGKKIDYNDENKKHYIQTLFLFLTITLIIVSSQVLQLPLLQHDILFSALLILCTIVFVFFDFKNFIKLFRFTLRLKPILFVLLGAPLLALLVIPLANFIEELTGFESMDYYLEYKIFTSNMYLYGILFVSIMPGLFEEFLFRGILFNHLLKLTSPKSTIIISSILFSFIHFSIISIVWLAAIGLFLGYLRFRYRTIWYSIFFHALYNGSIFFLEMYI